MEDDDEQFNGSKPSSVVLFDEIIDVNSWSEAYLEVHKRLYKRSPQIYIDYLVTDDCIKEQIASADENMFSKSYKLGEGVFLNQSFRNVKRMIKRLRIFVEYYAEQIDGAGGDALEDLIFELA